MSIKIKFLNWWLGLEFICCTDIREIGKSISKNISRIMSITYFYRLLRDLLITLKYCEIEWSEILQEASSCSELNDLTISQLIEILQNQNSQEELWKQYDKYPVLVYRGKKIGEWITDTNKSKDILTLHSRRVEWHINRIYRIRCNIVHGSEVHHQLGLMIANLEYYLKQSIVYLIDSFKKHKHIKSIEEIFCRTSLAYDRMIHSLVKNDAEQKDIREAIFTDIVICEKDKV